MKANKIVNICDSTILFSLYAIAFFFPISKGIIETLSSLAILCYILKKILGSKDIPKTPLNLAVFAYLIICFFSIFNSTNTANSLRTFVGKGAQEIFFFFVVADTLNTERRLKNFLSIFFLSAAVLGIDGVFQYFTHKEFIRNRPYYYIPRIHATFPTSNDFACYLYMVIPFVLVCFFVKNRSKLFRYSCVALFILLFTCLMLTMSRGGWFAFVGMLLFMSFWIRPLALLLVSISIFLFLTRHFYSSWLKERLNNFFVFRDTSVVDRSIMWRTAWRMFMHRPWLGIGLGTFMFNFRNFTVQEYSHGVPYAHNCYLQMAAEIGVLGLGAFLLILAVFFYRGIKALNTRKRDFHWYILLASLAAIAGYSVQMVVDTIFYSLDLGLLFWLILGLGTAAFKGVYEL